MAGGIPVIKALREGLAGNRMLPRRRHPQRHLQLHPHRDARARAANSPTCWPRRRSSATPRPIPTFDVDGIDAAHKLAILAALAFGRPVAFGARACRGHPPRLGARHRLRRRTRLPHQAAGDRPPHRGGHRGAGASLHGAAGRADGAGRRRVQRRGGGGRLRRPDHAGGPRRRRRADRLGGGGRSDRHRPRPGDRRSGAPPRARCDAPSVPIAGACRRLLPAPDGGRPARRDRRRDRRAARRGHLAGEHAAARPQPRRGGAGGAGDPRDRRGGDARRAGPYRRAGRGA